MWSCCANCVHPWGGGAEALGGRAGQGDPLQRTGPLDGSPVELVTQQQLPVMIQAFLPQVSEGDKRILLVNGEPLGAVNRKPKAGEFRSNLAVGGQPATDLSLRERQICEVLRLALIEAGLFFVGIDVIAGHLSEIDVTSPTGIREVEQLGKIPWLISPSSAYQANGELLLQHLELEGHLLQFPLRHRTLDQARPAVSLPRTTQHAAANRHPQLRITGAIDPTNWGMAPAQGLPAQPGHRSRRAPSHSRVGRNAAANAGGLRPRTL